MQDSEAAATWQGSEVSPSTSIQDSRGRSHLAGELGVSPSTSMQDSIGRCHLAGVWGNLPQHFYAGLQRVQPSGRGLEESPPALLYRTPEGAATWQGSGGVSQYFQAGVQRAQPSGRGLGESPPALLCRTPEGAATWQGSGGVPQYFQAGVQRAQPPGRGLKVSPSTSIGGLQRPQPPGRGLGVSPSTSKRESRGRSHLAGVWGCLPVLPSGSPEGAAIWQGSGGVPQTLFLLPPSFQEGGQGDGPSHS